MSSAVTDPHRLRALESAALLDTPAEMVFDRLTNLASRMLGVPVALVSLVTPDRQFFKSQCGLPSPVSERRETPLSHSFCQYVVEDGAALVVEDARLDERLKDNLAIPDLGVIAYAGFPIREPGGHVLGSFCVIDDRPRVWSRGDLEVLSELAAAATDIVALRAEAVASGAAGRRLQRALVPEPPALPGAEAAAVYRPGEQRSLLGGDFFLCEGTPDGSVALVIGDVAGHGPEAAAFAMSLRSTWRAMLLAPGLGLVERAATLNRIALAQRPDVGVYATALLCEIDPESRLAVAVNAGHPPLVRLGSGGASEVALPPCPPLGIIADPPWAAGEVELEPGGALLAYTDGLVESRAAPGSAERLGAGPILELAGAMHAEGADGHTLLTALVELAGHAAGEPPDDDVAAVLVSVP
jgi:serine phosphatase RsbU (regulator of sigma subunit)